MQPENAGMNPKCNRAVSSGLIAGLVMTAAGVILLLDRTGVIEGRLLFRFWPSVLVIIGLLKLFLPEAGGGRIWGALLIMAGAVLQLSELGIIHVRIWDLWPLALIAVGLVLIWSAIESRKYGSAGSLTSSTSYLNELAVFGGGERRNSAPDFQGGQVVAVFGGFKVDLTKASMKENQAMIEVNAIFGGGEIVVPENWNVIMRGLGIFGGFADNTRHPKHDDPALKTLVVRGLAMFGGAEVKN
jgi:predicted membrane protein